MESFKAAWEFFQNEILGMHWLNRVVGGLLKACGLNPAGRLGGSVQFFVYDLIKIMVLLGVLIFAVSYIQSYFPPERTRRILGVSTASALTVWLPCSERSRLSAPARPSRCSWASPGRGCLWG